MATATALLLTPAGSTATTGAGGAPRLRCWDMPYQAMDPKRPMVAKSTRCPPRERSRILQRSRLVSNCPTPRKDLDSTRFPLLEEQSCARNGLAYDKGKLNQPSSPALGKAVATPRGAASLAALRVLSCDPGSPIPPQNLALQSEDVLDAATDWEVGEDEEANATGPVTRGLNLNSDAKERFYGTLSGPQVQAELQRLATVFQGMFRDFGVVKDWVAHLADEQAAEQARNGGLEENIIPNLQNICEDLETRMQDLTEKVIVADRRGVEASSACEEVLSTQEVISNRLELLEMRLATCEDQGEALELFRSAADNQAVDVTEALAELRGRLDRSDGDSEAVAELLKVVGEETSSRFQENAAKAAQLTERLDAMAGLEAETRATVAGLEDETRAAMAGLEGGTRAVTQQASFLDQRLGVLEGQTKVVKEEQASALKRSETFHADSARISKSLKTQQERFSLRIGSLEELAQEFNTAVEDCNSEMHSAAEESKEHVDSIGRKVEMLEAQLNTSQVQHGEAEEVVTSRLATMGRRVDALEAEEVVTSRLATMGRRVDALEETSNLFSKAAARIPGAPVSALKKRVIFDYEHEEPDSRGTTPELNSRAATPSLVGEDSRATTPALSEDSRPTSPDSTWLPALVESQDVQSLDQVPFGSSMAALGRLRQGLQGSVPEAPATEGADLEAVKDQARDALEAANRAEQEADLEAVKDQARDALEAAQRAEQEADLEAVKDQARDALEAAQRAEQEADLEAVKDQAVAALVLNSEDSERAEQEADLEAVKDQARDALEAAQRAEQEADLEAVNDLAVASLVLNSEDPDRAEQEADLEAVKDQARDVLEAAKRAEQEADLEAVENQIRDILEAAQRAEQDQARDALEAAQRGEQDQARDALEAAQRAEQDQARDVLEAAQRVEQEADLEAVRELSRNALAALEAALVFNSENLELAEQEADLEAVKDQARDAFEAPIAQPESPEDPAALGEPSLSLNSLSGPTQPPVDEELFGSPLMTAQTEVREVEGLSLAPQAPEELFGSPLMTAQTEVREVVGLSLAPHAPEAGYDEAFEFEGGEAIELDDQDSQRSSFSEEQGLPAFGASSRSLSKQRPWNPSHAEAGSQMHLPEASEVYETSSVGSLTADFVID